MRIVDYIKVPYTTIPRMEKYEGPLLQFNPSKEHLMEKQKELQFQGENIWFQSDIAYHHKLISKACEVLGLERETEITKLGLKIQEDIAIVHRGRLEAAFVAFPSGWKPGDKQGLTLEELHRPVADGDILRKYSNRLSDMMCKDICYHRGVWTLTTSKYLSAYPDYVAPEALSLNDLWFRSEHQITFPIVKGLTSGFLIDVHLTPFLFLPNDLQERIKESINSMTDSVLVYKRLDTIKKLLKENK